MSNCCSKQQDQNMDTRIKIFLIMAAVLITGGIVAGIISAKNDQERGVPKMALSETNFDFGTISMADGLAKHKFSIKNEGTGDLVLSNIQTSCMCTTAVLEANGEKSPSFGMHGNSLTWSQKLKQNQEATLEIIFDPNAHGPDATGPITRKVTMLTNDGNKENQKATFTFTADVVK